MNAHDREHNLYRARAFAALLVEHTTKLWPDSNSSEMPAQLLVEEHNRVTEQLAFLATELDSVLQDLSGDDQ